MEAIILGKLCLTTTIQGTNAPFIDRAFTTDDKNRRYAGVAILLTPWMRKYGESITQRALVVGWRKP
ncbi:MAG: hypothetical protein NUV80_01250 [Candidatus Berkelbacteria bacterium]|nr:hypothetical protein [Candidatus Berkelbacteria bacterium]